ncbi:MAG: rhodanese-like domain-containing protein, partial [Alphaproteobacteria bacterium]
MSLKDRRLADLRARIAEVTVADALALQRDGALLVDVREDEETATGSSAGALRLPRGFLELRIEEKAPDPARPILLMCAGGTRSLFAAEDLLRLGYQDVRSVAGGFSAWKAAGLPVEVPPQLDAAQRERYRRHLTMPEVGEAGQHRLLRSRVALIGAGGLGS